MRRRAPGGDLLGLDIGGSKLLALRLSPEGEVLGRAQRATGRGVGPDEMLTQVVEVAEALSQGGPFAGVGVGFPGPVDAEAGLARSSVMLDGWRAVPLAERIREALGPRVAGPVRVDNDVNCAALAELWWRRAQGGPGAAPDSMIFVAVGTGIGGALTLGGALWRGASGIAGEVGHVAVPQARGLRCPCGRQACVSLLASGRALAAGRCPVRGAEALGAALASVINVLDPALIALGGGVVARRQGWAGRVAEAARAGAFAEAQCRIEPAVAGYEAGAFGAALLPLEAPGVRRASAWADLGRGA